jgi:mRNA-degrading endonuclease RelE of RelBE toxin-antitoxin system
MPRYTALWLKRAEEQRDSLPATIQRLVEHRVEELLEDPTGDPHALYYQLFDEWNIPFALGADE